MTPLSMALLFMVIPIIWFISGALVAVITSGFIKGRTALERLPKNVCVILFWPFWLFYVIFKK